MKVKKELEQKVLDAIYDALINMGETDVADIYNDFFYEAGAIYYGEYALDVLVDDIFERSFVDAFNSIADLATFSTNAPFYQVNNDNKIVCADSVFDFVNPAELAKRILDEWGGCSGYDEIDDAINDVLEEEGEDK